MIHKTAIIEDGAIIGKNVSVGAFSYISSNVSIGDNTSIANHSTITGQTTIGKNNKIFPYVYLGADPQDLKFDGEDSLLIIGDNNTIREFSSLNKGTKGGGNKTVFGNNNLIMSHVHIGHDCIIKNNCIIVSGCALGGHVEIDDFAIIGGNSSLHQFVKVGEHAMLGAASMLSSDLPPYCMGEGNKAYIRGLNLTGLRRNLKPQIDPLKKAYKEIFTSGHSMKEIAKQIMKTDDNEYIIKLAKFVIDSKRGISRQAMQGNNNK